MARMLFDGGIRAMTSLTEFKVSANSFTGMLQERSINAMMMLTKLVTDYCRFRGTLPDGGMRAMMALRIFRVRGNGFAGTLPEGGLRAMMAVASFRIDSNRFAGGLPNGGIEAMNVVRDFVLMRNRFTGTLPDSSIRAWRAMQLFFIGLNRFTGMLPVGGIRAMMMLTFFTINTNSFRGMLADSTMQAMKHVSNFLISDNSFTGSLPNSSIRAMAAVIVFVIELNSFTGMLPDSISVMEELSQLHVARNRFVSTLPSSLNSLRAVFLHFDYNFFEGTIPVVFDVQVLHVDHNPVEGSIPQQLLLAGPHATQKAFAASEVLHEGTIPESASRMTMAEIILSFGHGLRGDMPSIQGTVTLLSLWENGVDGHLPELHITDASVLFVHANKFSCALPRNGEVSELGASLALIGNYFAQPQQLPAWITAAERPSDMFCVSNAQGKRFVMLLGCIACLFSLSLGVYTKARVVPSMRGRFAWAKSAWCETSKHMAVFAVASYALLPVYNSMLALACTVVSEHLRFHFVAGTRLARASLEVMVHVCLCRATVGFYHRHLPRMMHLNVAWRRPDKAQPRHRRAHAVAGFGIPSVWWLICVLASAPGVFYAAVKVVPGFLQVSRSSQWFVSNCVALFAALMSGFGLGVLAGQLFGPEVDGARLQLVGLLLASILLPCLVTTLCHAKCLGAWTRAWRPCTENWLFLRTMKNPVKPKPGEPSPNFRLHIELPSRKDICSLRWHMDRSECMEAVTDHLVWLLYPKFAHYGLTMAAFRVLRAELSGKGMRLKEANVLLNYTWLVVTMFGPCLPVLNTLIAFLANIYSILLFGTSFQLLDSDESQERSEIVQRFGFNSAIVLALVWQSGNLPCLPDH